MLRSGVSGISILYSQHACATASFRCLGREPVARDSRSSVRPASLRRRPTMMPESNATVRGFHLARKSAQGPGPSVFTRPQANSAMSVDCTCGPSSWSDDLSTHALVHSSALRILCRASSRCPGAVESIAPSRTRFEPGQSADRTRVATRCSCTLGSKNLDARSGLLRIRSSRRLRPAANFPAFSAMRAAGCSKPWRKAPFSASWTGCCLISYRSRSAASFNSWLAPGESPCSSARAVSASKRPASSFAWSG